MPKNMMVTAIESPKLIYCSSSRPVCGYAIATNMYIMLSMSVTVVTIIKW